ncbi:hypothetical protein [Teredinibacter sp. KSP-S5-2]|uniref:hypothetical protein n=1 Tax=Teredinibacter sp. KSP-S5-2 TaxID=3034506 RepID=UPI002934BABD|nr:hypothetical protein [Teredinibacter sp. KSP-S5-2]WNO10305.1 hypothetical protein P5V12_03875 [Teredinibacter sp. KSP-S5-2]
MAAYKKSELLMKKKLVFLFTLAIIFPVYKLMATELAKNKVSKPPVHFDQKVFDQVESSGVVSVKALDAMNVALNEFKAIRGVDSSDYYIVKSESLDNIYKVFFLIPRNKPVVGGGTVIYEIDKVTLKVVSKEMLK